MEFFQESAENSPKKTKGKGENPPEKVEKSGKRPAKGEKVGNHPQSGAGQHENSVFSVAHIEGKKQIAQQEGQGEPEIQQMAEPWKIPPQPPQKIKVDAVGKAKDSRQKKLTALQAEGLLHQPKRRRKRPPDFWGWA